MVVTAAYFEKWDTNLKYNAMDIDGNENYIWVVPVPLCGMIFVSHVIQESLLQL